MVRTEGRGAGAHCPVRVDLVDLHGVVVRTGEEVPGGYRCQLPRWKQLFWIPGLLTRRFVVEHACVGVRVVARRKMHLVDGTVAADHLRGLEGKHISVLLAV